ncbi:hypothetical protein M3Y94_00723500 [Aphelenchoides besseyi]|nr:hypothetical protein M3Y94_00723500 [Aphelenchoides besseyi]KAI6231818.1 Inhibitor of growth protein [Aphelenchoides besseyi]
MNAPLARFMKKLSSLPESVKTTFNEIGDLDRECESKHQQFVRLCFELLTHTTTTTSGKRTTTKGVNNRRKYDDLLKLLSEWEEKSTEKLQLTSECYEEVDRQIIELDKAYGKFTQNITNNPQTDKKKSNGKLAGGHNRKRKARQQDGDTDGTLDSLDFDSPLVEMPVDPNEPTYCICHQISFGQMICCDGKNCPTEWFHFQCVGLTTTPKGKWFCDHCKESVVVKRGRKSGAADKK